MSSLIFKIFLPTLLGYTLFVGFSGQFNPFSKPSEIERRPSWLLGAWVGFSVALVLGVMVHTAYQLPLEAVGTLAKPTGLLLAALVVPGLIAYLVYRRVIRSHLNDQKKLKMSAGEIMDAQIEETEFDGTLSMEMEMETESDISDTAIVMENNSKPVSDAGEIPNHSTKVVDSGNNGSVSLLFDSVEPPSSNENLHATNDSEVLENAHTPVAEDDTAEVVKLRAEVDELKQSLDTETSLRNQTETHLRITRKALKNLEGDTRDFESVKADALISVEGQLDSRIKEVAAAQALASREEAARIEAETTIINIKQDMLETKRELRRNTEARAKALGTANKTVAFARQSVQARNRAEARIKQLENRLKLSQETVSSLIAALDKEKARTQSDVTEMAKELILQQKRINEKRTLDEAGRRTPKRLTRHTAKKVS